MKNDDSLDDRAKAAPPRVSRRVFAALMAAGAASAAHAAEVMEMDVTVTTPDGACDAALFRPAGTGGWPAVVFFADALGLRPVFRDMGRRMASQGYVVLVPNPFYRSARAPVFTGPFDFANPTDRAKLTALRAPMTPEAVARDAVSYFAFLDSQPTVHKAAKGGVVGYCMGGPMVLQAAAALPGRIGAACSFHGGGLVTDQPSSPHLLIPKTKAAFYLGVAANDDASQPAAKDVLATTFAAAGLPAEIEVYVGCDHGWCVKDGAAFNEAGAEKAWTKMSALYRAKLI